MNTLSFDTEFRDTAEERVTPVAAVVRIKDREHRYFFPADKAKFKGDWDAWMTEGNTIVCFYASAETRFLLALDYTIADLLSWKWLDVWVGWRMLTHSHPDYRYGRKVVTRKDGKREWLTTTPPPFGEASEDEWGEDESGNSVVVKEANAHHSKTETSLAACIAHQSGLDVDTAHKEAMRTLILAQDSYSPEEREQILDYCASDTVHLLPLLRLVYKALHTLSSGECGLDQLGRLSRYSVCCGKMESNGIPIHLDKAAMLGKNYRFADTALIEGIQAAYPFYTKRKTTKKERLSGQGPEKYVESKVAFESYVKNSGLESVWPKSPAGGFKKDKDTLKAFGADQVIMNFWTCKNSRNQLKYFRPVGFDNIKKNIGSDGRIRVLLSPFGSKTGRNQPSVRAGYLLGMSTWLRPLIGKDGEVLQGADFSAQEIALQGWVSGDQSFLEAYASGDPYTWFSQITGVMGDGLKRGKKGFLRNGVLVSDKEQGELKGIRNTFKALLLGVGFGMGNDKLAASLTQAKIGGLPQEEQNILARAMIERDNAELQEQAYAIRSGVRIVSGTENAHDHIPKNQKATTYKGYHKKVFKAYWAWRDKVLARYKRDGYLILPDGFCLFTGEDRANTIANFLVQGMGATILRLAVEKCLLAGLHIIAPLHDCVYILSKPEDAKADALLLCVKMREAVAELCGSDLIRIDAEQYTTDWVEGTSVFTKDKQGKEFKKYCKYMLEDFTPPPSDDAWMNLDEVFATEGESV